MRRRHRLHGFTLIELMITVVVVAILAAIALPAYRDTIERTRRTDARASLEALAQQLERCRTQFGRYDDAGCVVPSPQDSVERHYQITLVRDAATFTLTATPQGAQASDSDCASLSLTHLGQRQATGADTRRCW
jgi:type IV pilus assembly protein PilE